MKLPCLVCVVLFFLGFNSFAQNEKLLKGRVVGVVKSDEVKITNFRNHQETKCDSDGFFYIDATEKDTLLLSSRLIYIQKIVSKSEYNSGEVIAKVDESLNYLPEVVVSKGERITAQSLGIVSKSMKHYTQQERKYHTSMTGPVHYLINSLNGNKKRLKKNIEVEKKKRMLEKLEIYIEDDFYLRVLKIEESDIKSFQYFLVEDSEFRAVFESKKKEAVKFKMIDLCPEFKKRKEISPD